MSAFFEELKKLSIGLDNFGEMHYQCELEAMKIIRQTINYDSRFPGWFKEDGKKIVEEWWDTEKAKIYWYKTKHSKLLIEFEILFNRLGQGCGRDMADPIIALFKINRN